MGVYKIISLAVTLVLLMQSSGALVGTSIAPADDLRFSSQVLDNIPPIILRRVFIDETYARLPIQQISSWGISLGDVDGDGDLDIFVDNTSGWLEGQNRLYINNGSGFFADETLSRLPILLDDSMDAEFGDVDGDGDQDVYVANRYDSDRLLINNGEGFFIDETVERLPTTVQDYIISFSVTFGDVDKDGDLDVVLARDWEGGGSRNCLLINDGHGYFSDESSRLPDMEHNTMDIELGDVDGDGDLDMIVADFQGEGYIGNEMNHLWINNGNGFFRDETSGRLPVYLDDSWDAEFGDVDKDGDLDILIANCGSHFNPQKNNIFINDGHGYFADETDARIRPITNNRCSSAAEFGDVDMDGDLDFVVVNWVGQTNRQNQI